MSKCHRKKDKKRASHPGRKGQKKKAKNPAKIYHTHTMNESALTTLQPQSAALPADPGSSPFKIVVDPAMRTRLREALIALIENHDLELARHFSEDRLALDSYKEYIEIFAHSLKQTMESPEGVNYLLKSCGFEVKESEINLHPETRWKE